MSTTKKLRGLHGTMTFKRGTKMSDAVDYAERLGCRVQSAGRDGRKVQVLVQIPIGRDADRFAMSWADRQFAFERATGKAG